MNLNDLKKAVSAGVLAGIGCAMFFIFAFRLEGVHPIARVVDFWIPALFIGFFIWLIRQSKAGQPFHFWQGLMVGNCIGFVCGITSGVSLFLFFSYVSDASLNNYLASAQKLLALQNQQAKQPISASSLAQAQAEIAGFNPARLIWEEIFRKVSYCFVLVPLISIFFRKK